MTLNRTQRIIVRIGGCILLFELLFPPWTKDPEYGSGARFNHFLFSPPKSLYTVDTMLLFVQTATIVTGTALLVWWFQPHQAITQSPPEKTSERGILQRFRSLRGPQKTRQLRGWRRVLPGDIISLCLILLLVILSFFIA